MKLNSTVILVIAFIAACILVLAMLPSSIAACREGVDATLSKPPAEPPAAAEDDDTDRKIIDLDTRLTALEASVKESKDSIADGEMEANAAIGNLQMTLPS